MEKARSEAAQPDQLGHSEITTTARHYAKWIDADEYREPIPLLPGEVPADLIARISGAESPRTPHEADSTEVTDSDNVHGHEDLRGSGGWTRTNDLRLMKPRELPYLTARHIRDLTIPCG